MAFFQQTADFVTDSTANLHTQRPFLAVVGASVALGLALGSLWSSPPAPGPKIVESPLKSFKKEKKESLVVPLDILPGARDVSTPYGSIRVYEWGPETGPKVLLVHGISAPSISLGGLAHALVDRGCRVMAYDLYEAL